MDLMGPLMVMEYKQLVEVHIKPLMQLCNLLRRERYNGCILIHLSWYTVWFQILLLNFFKYCNVCQSCIKLCLLLQVQTIRQGYLSKRSSNLRGDWKRRFFVLDSRGMLYYYRKESSKPSVSKLDGICLRKHDTKSVRQLSLFTDCFYWVLVTELCTSQFWSKEQFRTWLWFAKSLAFITLSWWCA